MLGPGSTFSLDGAEHRERRKLLVPPFHGKRMAATRRSSKKRCMREIATWPEGQEFETLPSMMRITLNAILRAVFGAEGAALDELRDVLPSMVLHASRLAVHAAGRAQGLRAVESRGRRVARSRSATTRSSRGLIADIRSDPAFEDRTDVLSLMLQARYEDGSPISDDHVADELLTLLAAGHETTATTLAWAVERLRRHPRLLARLTAEVDARRIRTASGHHLGGAAHPARDQRHRTHDQDTNASGGVGDSGASRGDGEHLAGAPIRGRVPRRGGRSIRTGSSATRRTTTRGFRTAAGSGAASAPPSPTWR